MKWACVVAVLVALGSPVRAEDELPNAVPTVMYKPWSASIAYGPAFLMPRMDDGPERTAIFFELAFRYRLLRELEVGASIGGALRRSFGYVAVNADVRYRFRAEMAWSPYVLGSIGIAKFDPSEPWGLFLRGGLGIERRFKSWAFSSDAQLSRTAANEDVYVRDIGSELSKNGTLGVTIALAALYYWGSGGPALRRHGVP